MTALYQTNISLHTTEIKMKTFLSEASEHLKMSLKRKSQLFSLKTLLT